MECMNLGGCGSHKQVHEFCKHTTCMSSPVGWLHVSTHILVFSSRIIIIIIVIFLYIYLEYPVHTIIQRILFSSFVPVLNFYLDCAAFSQVYTLIVFYLFILSNHISASCVVTLPCQSFTLCGAEAGPIEYTHRVQHHGRACMPTLFKSVSKLATQKLTLFGE